MIQVSNTLSNDGTNALVSQVNKSQEDNTRLKQTDLTTKSVDTTSTSETISDIAKTDIAEAYSVEISEEGYRLNALNSSTTDSESNSISTVEPTDTSSSVSSTLDNITQTSNTSQVSGTTASDETQSSDEEDDSDYTTEDLSQYSEYQLKQMLDGGEITQSEYNEEIASREEDVQNSTQGSVSA